MADDDEPMIELPVVLRMPIARLRSISLDREPGPYGGRITHIDGVPVEQRAALSARELIRRIDSVVRDRAYYEAKPHKAYSDLWRVLDILDEWRPPEQAEPSDRD